MLIDRKSNYFLQGNDSAKIFTRKFSNYSKLGTKLLWKIDLGKNVFIKGKRNAAQHTGFTKPHRVRPLGDGNDF